MANRLAHENSLYLRQHADNPVDWYPWGDDAFAAAQQQDKPLLVSIGYSACHWCHVMAHESFEDAYIAKLMNTHFICVKVDREERPDVDAIYMEAVQMLNGHGGWPLNVFCLPDGRPFAGGTYFPPDERRGHGIVPWPQLLMRVADFYQRQRADLEENASAIIGNLRASNLPHRATGDALHGNDLLNAAKQLLEQHDADYGGFGGAPKFPPSMALDFLLALRNSEAIDLRDRPTAQVIDAAVNRTLTGMAHGGLFDQIGGGFARYSVDAHWLIPHFEKMLYDNALLIGIYSRASQRYPKPLYANVVHETIAWLNREMAHPDGGFVAALDADTDGEEGATYLWTPQQVKAILGPTDGARFCEVYGISDEGNFEHTGSSNPALLDGDPAVRDALAPARATLLAARNQRPQPARDDKRLVAWNALLARSMAQAAWTFGQPEWLDQAVDIADWIWNDMRYDDDQLHSVAYDDGGRGFATLDDYTFSAAAMLDIAAIIDWRQPGQSLRWLERCITLVQSIRHHFHDPQAVGFFFTSDLQPPLVHRKKDWYDQAIPSGNAVLLEISAWLEVLTGNAEYADLFERLCTAYPGIAATSPSAAAHALTAATNRAVGLATLSCPPDTDLEAIRKKLAAAPWRALHLRVDPAAGQFQLCIGTQCMPPADSPDPLIELLAGTNQE